MGIAAGRDGDEGEALTANAADGVLDAGVVSNQKWSASRSSSA